MTESPLVIAITTVPTRQDADQIAATLIEGALAACVQIDGPMTSHYTWQGKHETADEYRIVIKTLSHKLDDVADAVHRRHPDDTPQWVVIGLIEASVAYDNWARQVIR
jgi:periplasmic divalent cation tolerance protein